MVVDVPVRLVLLVDGDGSGQTKVSQLQDALLCDQDIGRLHVSVDDLVFVQVLDPRPWSRTQRVKLRLENK